MKAWKYLLGLVEDDKGQLSTTRLILWGAFVLSSTKFMQIPAVSITWELMGGYLGVWVVGYVGGKFADAKASTPATQIDVQTANVDASK